MNERSYTRHDERSYTRHDERSYTRHATTPGASPRSSPSGTRAKGSW